VDPCRRPHAKCFRQGDFPRRDRRHYALIDRPNEKPWGVGEPSSAIVSAAISNAVFDAIGVHRIRVSFEIMHRHRETGA
jgi:CO/xanthine dehydrogenase Mo-binding subunit